MLTQNLVLLIGFLGLGLKLSSWFLIAVCVHANMVSGQGLAYNGTIKLLLFKSHAY